MRATIVHELYYWIALRLICGIGNVHYKNLIDNFGSPEKIFQTDADELMKVEGISARASESIVNFKANQEIDRELDSITSKGIQIITLNSPGYPENLRNIYDPPPYLYVKGEIIREDCKAIAVIGSRLPSEYGLRATKEISESLCSYGITIVSGMARGIDSYAHKAALASGGRTTAVLGCGVDVVYPPENRKLYDAISASGAVVSEYPMGTDPNSFNFPARNRIISGLSIGVLVVEANIKSGSLITAGIALDQGKDVFAIPGSIYADKSKGTNKLLKNGAQLVETADDIIESLQFKAGPCKKAKKKEIDKIENIKPELQTIYNLIHNEPVQIDELILKSQFSSSRISSALLELELNGFIKQLPGKRFGRC